MKTIVSIHFVAFLSVAVSVADSVVCAEDPKLVSKSTDKPSLKEKFGNQFLIGVGLEDTKVGGYSQAELALIRGQFNALTPANCMKMLSTQKQEGRFDFRDADAFTAFASAQGAKVCGHCLIWAKDERTPAWFFKDGTHAASRAVVQERMRKHIETIATRYRGKVVSWDVVNEALDDGSVDLRPSQWLSILGEDYLATAFRLARRSDPQAMLVYNDYNIELPFKREKLLRLLHKLLDQKVPIDAVGMQGHWELDTVPFRDIEETIAAIGQLGLKVMITEMDIDVIPRSRWWADGGKHREELSHLNPYPADCPPDILKRQAEQYAKLFAIFRRHSDKIARATFWDLHDGQSWLNDFPWHRRNYPLLFDRNAQGKPALDAVLAVP